LEEWVKPNGTVASVKEAEAEPNVKPDTDWLAGTNIAVTEKVNSTFCFLMFLVKVNRYVDKRIHSLYLGITSVLFIEYSNCCLNNLHNVLSCQKCCLYIAAFGV